jgi:hypothetical protein
MWEYQIGDMLMSLYVKLNIALVASLWNISPVQKTRYIKKDFCRILNYKSRQLAAFIIILVRVTLFIRHY